MEEKKDPEEGNSGQGFVAPPERVRLGHRPRGQEEEVELPLRLLFLGDFTGREDLRPVEERRPIEVNKKSFDEVMERHALRVSIEVPNVLHEGAAAPPIAVQLRVQRLVDLEPERVAKQVPELRALLELRAALTALKGPLGGEKAFRRSIQRAVDDPASRRRIREEIGIPPVAGEVVPPPPPLPPEVVAAIDQARSATDAAVLAQLAEHGHAEVRAAVAANPSTPPPVLFRLSSQLPGQVARNPVMAFLPIEFPDWTSRLARACLKKLLEEGGIASPAALLGQMASSARDETRTIAAEDPRTPPATLADLARDDSRWVRACVADNPSLPIEAWRPLTADRDTLPSAARYPGAPPEWLRAHSRHESASVRVGVAANPGSPPDVLAVLLRDPEVRRGLARRADLSPDIARALAADPDYAVRAELARHPGLPPDLFPVLLADPDDTVRRRLLYNPSLPPGFREPILARQRAEWSKLPYGKGILDPAKPPRRLY